MRICSAVGSVTVAVPLLVTAISFLLLLELLQHDVELVEPLRPGAFVVLHPVVDGLERRPVEPIHARPSFAAPPDRPPPCHADIIWLYRHMATRGRNVKAPPKRGFPKQACKPDSPQGRSSGGRK